MQNVSLIEKALPIVAAAYARKFGVRISVGGSSAHTNGSHIQLPAIPEDYPFKDALWGFLAHEAAHIRFTDFEPQSPSEYHHGLVNSLEDGRIEEAFILVYPGAKQVLDDALAMFVAQGHMEPVNEDDDPADILAAYVLYWVRYQWRGQKILQDQMASAQLALEAVFPKGACVRLQALMRKAPAMKSTQDAMDLVDEILAMLKEEAEKEPPQPENGSQQQSNSDDAGDKSQSENSSGNQSDESGNDKSDAGAKGQSKDESGKSEGDDSSKTKEGEKGNQSSQSSGSSDGSDAKGADSSEGDSQKPQSSGGASSAKTGDQLKKAAIQKALQGDGSNVAVDVFSVMKEAFEKAAENNPDKHLTSTLPDEIDSVPMSKGRADAMEGGVKATSIALRKQLLGLVQSQDKVEKRYLDRGRKIATRRLAKTVGGNMRVFKHRKESPKVNTAVHLLVDASSSMASEPMRIANEAALAMAFSLEALPRVSPAVSYFCGDVNSPVISVLKHGQSVKHNVNRFGVASSGTTPMGSALWHAANTMAGRKENRKLVIVVTDGGPSDGARVRHSIELMKRSGYEVMAIGINSDAVARYFTDYCVINSVEDLKTALFDLIRRKLTS